MTLAAEYEPVIGLEVHAQMLTETKAFCGCSSRFGGEPNTNVCPVCLGMPGTLPVLNRALVEYIIRMGLAVDCRIATRSVFARKNYFYPDLPKGYQISQFEEPICADGVVEVDGDDQSRKRIRIKRIHMEEDAGKLIHDQGADTLVDVNRCGVPLIEIVTEPDIGSAREAYQYLMQIKQLVTYLGVCDGNMEEGSLRCDANVSVRKRGENRLGTKSEVKNMNSFRNVERALEFEIQRQISLIEDGGLVMQETLLWDADAGVAIPMRSKEEAHDYRYFPDPDLVPVVVDEDWLVRARASLPELPRARRDRYIQQYALPPYDADILTTEKETADYFEAALDALHAIVGDDRKESAKAVSNWVMTDVLRVVSERKVELSAFPVQPARLAAMIGLIRNGTISGKIAKEVFEEMLSSPATPGAIVQQKGLVQLSDEGAIEQVVDQMLGVNAVQVEKYLAGNEKIFGFFVGETMKLTKGKANPRMVNELLRKKLSARRG